MIRLRHCRHASEQRVDALIPKAERHVRRTAKRSVEILKGDHARFEETRAAGGRARPLQRRVTNELRIVRRILETTSRVSRRDARALIRQRRADPHASPPASLSLDAPAPRAP